MTSFAARLGLAPLLPFHLKQRVSTSFNICWEQLLIGRWYIGICFTSVTCIEALYFRLQLG